MDDEFLDPNDYYADQDENRASDFGINGGASQENLHRSVGWLAAFLLLSAIVWMYSYPNWFSSSNSGVVEPNESMIVASERPRSNIVSNKLEEITGLSLPDSMDWRKQEEIAANRSAVEDFRTKLESISTIGTANTEQLLALQAKTQDLLTSKAGAKIGADSKYVEQYIALREKIEKLTVSIPVADEFASDMLALLNRVKAAGDTSYAPQQFVTTRANEYQKELQEKTAELKRYDVAVDRLVATTRGLVGEFPLESAVNSLLERESSDLAETLSKALKETKRIKNAELVRATQNKIAAEFDLKIEKGKVETAKVIAKRKELAVSAEKRRLELEFDRDRNDINAYLIPFISEGRNMRGNAAGKGPASFSAIQKKGALENTAEGLASLSMAAKNGRPLGGFPEINIMAHMITNNSTPGSYHNTPKYRGIEAYLEKAQSLLNKYGPLMVEKGLLAE